MNAFYNFVQNKVITIRSKDTLWMTHEIKKMINEKVKIYRRHVKHGRSIADYQILRDITSRCKSVFKETKSSYFSRFGESLNDPAITPKKYWSILHSFPHKHKIPKIPHIREDTLVKANTFNSFLQSNVS